MAGNYSTKPPNFRPGLETFSLNVESNYQNGSIAFSHLLLKRCSSAKNLAVRAELLKYAFRGVINKKTPHMEFSSQNALLHNFLKTQHIHTSTNAIDAARQVKYNTKSNAVKISISWSSFHEKFPIPTPKSQCVKNF
jgi:hypothetical protein